MVKKKTSFFNFTINWWFFLAVLLLILPLVLKWSLVNAKDINNLISGLTTITRFIASILVFIGFMNIYKNWYAKQLVYNQNNKETLKNLSWFELKLLILFLFKNDGFKIKTFDKNNKLYFIGNKDKESYFIDASNWDSDITIETVQRANKLFNTKKLNNCYLLTLGKVTSESYILAKKSLIKIFDSNEVLLMIKNIKEEKKE